MPLRFYRSPFYGFLAILALSAMAMLYISTPAGAGLANDSAAYIAGARSIMQGTGYSDIWLDGTLEPITHYPPLFSLTLAIVGLVKIDPLRGARIINILLFGANTAVIGLLGWRMTRSRAAGLWLAALFLLSASLLRVHVYAMSEPLFIFLSLLSFLFIGLYFDGSQKSFWLIPAGLTTGLAFLTRYSGLALLPTFVIALVVLQNKWQARLKAAGLFLACAVPLMAAWFIRNKLAAGNATNRSFQYHPITAENIQPGFYNFSQFLMPFEPWRRALVKSGSLEWILFTLGIVLLLWLAVRAWRLITMPESGTPQPITFTTVIYIFGYLGAVLFSMSFFDASTKFQPRILAPLYVTLMMVLVAFGVWVWRKNNRPLQGFVIGLIVVTLAFSAYDNFQTVGKLKEGGQGYASWKWRDSLVMGTLRNLPPETAIYTNTPPAVYLVTGRASRVLPTEIDPVDNLPRTDYEQNVALMSADLLAGRAVLALFDTSILEDASAAQNIESLIAQLGVLQKTQGDILYGKP